MCPSGPHFNLKNVVELSSFPVNVEVLWFKRDDGKKLMCTEEKFYDAKSMMAPDGSGIYTAGRLSNTYIMV